MPIGPSGAGRALKTEFVLDYMAEPTLGAKVQRGLLKVEQLHARCVRNCGRGPPLAEPLPSSRYMPLGSTEIRGVTRRDPAPRGLVIGPDTDQSVALGGEILLVGRAAGL